MTDLPPLEIDGGDWYHAVPPPAVPVPAANLADLDGQRAIETADAGVLTDLRIVGATSREGATTSCTVTTELDYWRARLSPGQAVAARSVPIDRLWVEHRLAYIPPSSDAQPARSATGDEFAIFRRLAPTANSPAARMPVRARTVSHLHGRRIIQVTPLGFAWDLRAISEPYDLDGEVTVNVCSARDYYGWVISGRRPEPTALGLYLLWTE
ncbi:hypothetical protein [Streptomyces lunalinharesii]|uniref:Uncharacterized protein n=1 Tax=Streptomyces lunalinharesii TaxID=333384 RepID=A0ABP6FAQ7_9ACTN